MYYSCCHIDGRAPGMLALTTSHAHVTQHCLSNNPCYVLQGPPLDDGSDEDSSDSSSKKSRSGGSSSRSSSNGGSSGPVVDARWYQPLPDEGTPADLVKVNRG